MAKLDELRPGDRVYAIPAQQRGTVVRFMTRPEIRKHPVIVALNGTGAQRAFAPEELTLLARAGEAEPVEERPAAAPAAAPTEPKMPGAPEQPSEPEQPDTAEEQP